MCCKSFWKRIVPFAIALAVGVFIAGFLQKISSESQAVTKSASKKVYCEMEIKTGSGGGYSVETKNTKPLQITSKPRPGYTDAARQNQVTGIVRLRVTFLASGQIGSVTPVSSLPNGLTENATAAALNIRFEPATVNGQPITVTKTVEYSFSIY